MDAETRKGWIDCLRTVQAPSRAEIIRTRDFPEREIAAWFISDHRGVTIPVACIARWIQPLVADQLCRINRVLVEDGRGVSLICDCGTVRRRKDYVDAAIMGIEFPGCRLRPRQEVSPLPTPRPSSGKPRAIVFYS